MKRAKIELIYEGGGSYLVTALTNLATFTSPGPEGSLKKISSILTQSEVELLAISPNFEVTLILER
jgi:hypothetical protein